MIADGDQIGVERRGFFQRRRGSPHHPQHVGGVVRRRIGWHQILMLAPARDSGGEHRYSRQQP